MSVIFIYPFTPELNPSAQRCLQRHFTGILVYKRLIAQRLYKPFGVKGLMKLSLAQLVVFHDRVIRETRIWKDIKGRNSFVIRRTTLAIVRCVWRKIRISHIQYNKPSFLNSGP
jgi:hypothetical protein